MAPNLQTARAVLFLMLLLPGCASRATSPKAPEITPTAAQACPGYFYYYGQEKIQLTQDPQISLIGFKGNPTTAQKEEVLRRFPAFTGFSAGEKEDEDPGFQLADLKSGTTCAQVQKLIKELQQQELILFANPVFHALPSLGSGHRWMGLTPEFIVTMKPGQPESELQRLLSLTNTKQADTLGENIYLLRATKESKGNALEMANYFHQQPSVANAEPNFHMAGRPSGWSDH
jgi:hypothetical protein